MPSKRVLRCSKSSVIREVHTKHQCTATEAGEVDEAVAVPSLARSTGAPGWAVGLQVVQTLRETARQFPAKLHVHAPDNPAVLEVKACRRPHRGACTDVRSSSVYDHRKLEMT